MFRGRGPAPLLAGWLVAAAGCVTTSADLYRAPVADDACSSLAARSDVVASDQLRPILDQFANEQLRAIADQMAPAAPAAGVWNTGWRVNGQVPVPVDFGTGPWMSYWLWFDGRDLGWDADAPGGRPTSLTRAEAALVAKARESAGKDPFDADQMRAEAARFVRQPGFLVGLAAYGRPDPADAPVLVPVLSAALKDETTGTRAMAAAGLGKLGPAAAAAVPALAAALEDPNPMVRLHAAEALWQIQGRADAALPVLVALLGSDHPAVANLAASFLGTMGPAAGPAVPALGVATRHPDATVRAQAMFALGQIGAGARAAVPDLCQALDAPVNDEPVYVRVGDSDMAERSVRTYAALALGAIGPDAAAAVPRLAAMARSPWWWSEERAAAAEALRRIRAAGQDATTGGRSDRIAARSSGGAQGTGGVSPSE